MGGMEAGDGPLKSAVTVIPNALAGPQSTTVAPLLRHRRYRQRRTVVHLTTVAVQVSDFSDRFPVLSAAEGLECASLFLPNFLQPIVFGYDFETVVAAAPAYPRPGVGR